MARIALVDDEYHIVRMVEFKLNNLGHEIFTASDGGEALTVICAEHPDLVLLDVMMPVLDGFQVLSNLKGHEETKDIPVIMLTARGLEKDIVKGLELGAIDYINKPFSQSELVARINRALAQTMHKIPVS